VLARVRFRLYLVTDRELARPSLEEVVERALGAAPPGAVAVQVREKDLSGGPLLRLARSLREITERHGAPLLVNDRVDVALAVGATGVHLPREGLPVAEVRRLFPQGLVGVSTHSPAEVAQARTEGADFAVFGPVFDTPSKRRYGPPVGLAALGEAVQCGLPVFALGGVDACTAPAVARVGGRWCRLHPGRARSA
jgi:thiamine-phosphate pyrophosphorylase